MSKLQVGETLKRIVTLIILIITFQFLVMPLYLARNSPTPVLILGIIGCYLAYILMIIYAINLYQHQRRFEEQKFKFQNFHWIIDGLIFSNIIERVLEIMSLIFYNTVNSQNQDNLSNLLSTNKVVLYAMILPIVVFGPILEETFFRGYLIGCIFKPNQWVLPIITSGIIFAFDHAQSNIYTFGIYFVAGVYYAIVYKKTGTLKSSIIAHMLDNLFSIIPLLIQFH